MRTTIPLGRVAGVPVGAHWSALVGVLLLGQLLALSVLPLQAPGRPAWVYWLAGGLAAVGLVISLLAHELAHAIVARRAGLGVQRITLWLLGGVSELGGLPQRPGTEVRIALMGPAVSLGLGALFVTVTQVMTVVHAPALVLVTLSWLAAMNLLLGVFNLLPGTPLDGGRVLHGLLWRRSGDRDRATRAVTSSGQFIGSLLAALGVLMMLSRHWDGLWLVIVGWFLVGAAGAERSQAALTTVLSGLRARDVMTREPDLAPGWWTVDTFVGHLLGDTGPRHRTFPVVDIDGRPVGVVRLADLVRVPSTVRRDTTVRDVARSLPADRVLAADTPLDRLFQQLSVGRDIAVVVTDHRVVGVITAADLTRAVELAALHHAPDGPVVDAVELSDHKPGG
jgi:Zn-dependent protease/CBS domain-containing protein